MLTWKTNQMLKDHQVFTDVTDMMSHYKEVRRNLHKNVYVPKPRAEVPEPPRKKKLLVTEGQKTRPVLSFDPKYIEEYERSMAGLRAANKIKTPDSLTMREIVRQVAEKHKFGVVDITTPSRRLKVVAARHEAFYRMRHELGISYPRIAAFFGMDHTSVLHGVSNHEKKLQKEKANG